MQVTPNFNLQFMKNIRICFLSLIAFLFNLPSLLAQPMNSNEVEMAGVLHQNGKIYLVVLVLLTIFAGILFMLIRIEKKLSRLEKEK